MVTPNTSTCSRWATSDQLLACGPCADADKVPPTTPVGILNDALDAATDYLYQKSGRQFSGLCTTTVRPCGGVGGGQHLLDTNTWLVPQSQFSADCYDDSQCGCGGIPQVDLGFYPISNVDQVRIDGAVLASTAYEIHDYRYLVRIDGGSWPCCQDFTANALTDDNTWQVVIDYGVMPPALGERAAIVLGCELVRNCIGLDCALPKRVQTVSRQGMSMNMLDPFSLGDRTGIPEVDMFLDAYNPQGIRRAATVISPDIPKPVRRVTDVSTS